MTTRACRTLSQPRCFRNVSFFFALLGGVLLAAARNFPTGDPFPEVLRSSPAVRGRGLKGWLEDTRDKVKKQVKKIPIPNIPTSEEVQKWDGFEHAVGTDAAKKVRNIDGELENTKKEYNEWGVKTGKDIEKRVEGLKDDWDERAEEERQKVKEKYPDEYDEYEKYKATEEDNDKNSAGNWGRSNWGRSQCPVGSALKTSARKKNKENETCTLCTMYSP